MSKLTRDDVTVLNDDLPGWRGRVWLVEIAGQHYVLSAVDLEFGGVAMPDWYRKAETMAFACDADGHVDNYGELAMVPDKDHEACLADLLEALNERDGES